MVGDNNERVAFVVLVTLFNKIKSPKIATISDLTYFKKLND